MKLKQAPVSSSSSFHEVVECKDLSTYVANLLMGKLAVILQDVVVLGARSNGDLLCDGLRGNVSRLLFLQWIPGESGLTRSSVRCSSGISESFSPWCLGITSFEVSVVWVSALSFGSVDGVRRVPCSVG